MPKSAGLRVNFCMYFFLSPLPFQARSQLVLSALDPPKQLWRKLLGLLHYEHYHYVNSDQDMLLRA